MKIFVKLLMALVVLAVIAPFYLKDKQGMSLMSVNNIKMPNLSMPKIPQEMQSAVTGMTSQAPVSPEALDASQTKQQIKIHKWKDENGVWHFSSTDDSASGIKSKVILLEPAKNTFVATPPKQPVKEDVDPTDPTNITPSPLLPFTHGKVAMDQAKQVKALLEQRQKLQQQMTP